MKSVPEELNQLIPEPDADFLARLDERMTQLIDTRKGSNMTIATQVQPKILPFPRRRQFYWASAVAVLFLVLMLIPFFKKEEILSTPIPASGSPFQNNCDVQPQTNWVVHVPSTGETLDDIAALYYGKFESPYRTKQLIRDTNCLSAGDALPEYLFIPLRAEQRVVVSNIPIQAGQTITEEMLEYAIMLSPTYATYPQAQDLVGKIALTHIPMNTVLRFMQVGTDQITHNGETFVAGEDKLLVQFPNMFNSFTSPFQIYAPLPGCEFFDEPVPSPITYVACPPDYTGTKGYRTAAVNPIYQDQQIAILEVNASAAQDVYQIMFNSNTQRSSSRTGDPDLAMREIVTHPIDVSFEFGDAGSGSIFSITLEATCTEDTPGCPPSNPYTVQGYLVEALELVAGEPTRLIEVAVTLEDAEFLRWANENEVDQSYDLGSVVGIFHPIPGNDTFTEPMGIEMPVPVGLDTSLFASGDMIEIIVKNDCTDTPTPCEETSTIIGQWSNVNPPMVAGGVETVFFTVEKADSLALIWAMDAGEPITIQPKSE